MTDGGSTSRSVFSTAAATAGWGLFCSSSWTWCIGMYLPVILLRNWGWPGFWVFAIFNVVGCAGFGYLCTRRRSAELCERHAGAMTLFSVVTVAYQVFFVAFLASWVAQLGASDQSMGQPGAGPTTVPITWLVAFAAVVLGSLLSLAPDRAWPWLGAAATGVSYATWMALAPRVTAEHLAQASGFGTEGGLSLLFAAPIIALGFLLCPWLDRTFHRARQLAPSVHGFGVFGVTFFPIITMTAIYGTRGELDPTAPILAHLGTQLLFTIAVHVREIRLAPTPTAPRARRATLLVALLGGLLVAEASGFLGLSFETGYLLFLGCYGLLFPAYALLFMPGERAARWGLRAWPLSPKALGLFCLLILTLAPLCAIGFIALETWTLPIAFVAVLLAAFGGRLLVGPSDEARSGEFVDASPLNRR
jgi:hypothetical protein